jgi:hypothetical protein
VVLRGDRFHTHCLVPLLNDGSKMEQNARAARNRETAFKLAK